MTPMPDHHDLFKQIQTFFTPEMTGYRSLASKLLEEGVHFPLTIESDRGDILLKNERLEFTYTQAGNKSVDSNPYFR